MQNVLEQDPAYTEAQVVMAGMLAENGDFIGAERLYNIARRKNPKSVYIIHQYAAFLHLKGKVL